jgi:hypothetical protein
MGKKVEIDEHSESEQE